MSTTEIVKASPREVKALMESQADRLAALLPRHLSPDKVVNVVSTLVFRNPALQECSPASILAAVLQACELGLELSPHLGEAYLIPRWNSKARVNECQFQPGYQGLVKLARQSGAVSYISPRLVHAKDRFHYHFSPELEFEHWPHLEGDRGAVTHVYAVAKLTSGERLIEVMTRAEVEAIRQRSDNYKSSQRTGKPEFGPWVTDWNEMAMKTVLKRLCKRLPRSTELASAIYADDEEYRGGGDEAPALPRPATRTAALASRLGVTPLPEPEFIEGNAGEIKTEAEPAGREPGSDDA